MENWRSKMARRNFWEIVTTNEVNLQREYSRLYTLFDYTNFAPTLTCLHSYCSTYFDNLPFKGTCISLYDFEDTKLDITISEEPPNFGLDYLLSFCEYSYNLVWYVDNFIESDRIYHDWMQRYLNQVEKVIDLISYMPVIKDGNITIFVQKSPAAIAVSEIVSPKLAYKVLEYNHHQLRGDLDTKLVILKLMADDIEPQRKQLDGINSKLSNLVFELLNKFVRHSHEDNDVIKNMPDDKLEEYYDDIYQLWLLAKLELDNVERKKKFKELLEELRDNSNQKGDNQ